MALSTMILLISFPFMPIFNHFQRQGATAQRRKDLKFSFPAICELDAFALTYS
jgi:hypothetical protein